MMQKDSFFQIVHFFMIRTPSLTPSSAYVRVTKPNAVAFHITVSIEHRVFLKKPLENKSKFNYLGLKRY